MKRKILYRQRHFKLCTDTVAPDKKSIELTNNRSTGDRFVSLEKIGYTSS